MRLYELLGLAHLQKADLAVKKMLLESTGSLMKKETKPIHILRTSDLQSYVCSVFAILISEQRIFLNIQSTKKTICLKIVKVIFTKNFTLRLLHLAFFHLVHICVMFELLDSRLKMFKVLEPFEEQIRHMQHEDFKMPGRFKVKAFVNRNFEMLDLIMVHQLSANHPSTKDSVSLSHFAIDSGTPNTPGNCKTERRESFEFMEIYGN